MLSRVSRAGHFAAAAAASPGKSGRPARGAVQGLHNREGALSREESVAQIIRLWGRRAADSPLRPADLIHFTRLSHNNEVQLLLDRAYFTALLPALAAATDSVHLAGLTFDSGVVGEVVTDLLIAKKRAAPHLAIRILVDTWGSGSLVPWGHQPTNLRRLVDGGIEVIGTNAAAEGLEHRKLVIVDGAQAFFSGTCIAKEYYGSAEYWKRFEALVGTDTARAKSLFIAKYDPDQPVDAELAALDAAPDTPQYHDYGMRCAGDAVASLQAAFLQAWMLRGGVLEAGLTAAGLAQRYFPAAPTTSGTTLKIVNSLPGGAAEIGTTLFELVDAAQQRLDLTFPHVLIPQFVEALERAARRGVKVRLLVPGAAGIDLPAAFYAFRYEYPRLWATGNVEIYEFRQYTHIKLMVADQRLVFASTGNPEWSTWQRACDESALIDSPELARDIEQRVFAVDYSAAWATHVTPAEYAKMTPWQRWRMQLCRRLFDAVFRLRQLRPALARATAAASSGLQ